MAHGKVVIARGNSEGRSKNNRDYFANALNDNPFLITPLAYLTAIIWLLLSLWQKKSYGLDPANKPAGVENAMRIKK